MREIKRINFSFSSKIERRVLVKIAKNLPSWVNPDMLTLLALFSAAGICVSYIEAGENPFYLLIASFLFFLHWFGDSLDGTLARVRKIERPRYGHYVDHLMDSISIALILGGLTISSLTSTTIWLWVLVGFLLLMIEKMLFVSVKGEFFLSIGLIGPTEARIAGILLNLLIFFSGNPLILPTLKLWKIETQVRLIDLIGMLISFCLWFTLLIRALKVAALLNKEDSKLLSKKSKR